MAQLKPIIIDQEQTYVDKNATIADVVDENVRQVVTNTGVVIPLSEFCKTPVAEDITTNLHSIEKGDSVLGQLHQDLELTQNLLDRFEPCKNGEPRVAILEAGNRFMVIRNYPLPDNYQPDYIDVVLDVANYPSRPPVGAYILINNNESIIERIQKIFGNHIFEDNAYYQAEKLQGFAWICLHYKAHKWFYNANNIRKGDNIAKFLEMLFVKL